MNKRYLAAAILAGLTLAACSSVKSGTIVKKHHEPARQYTVSECDKRDKKGNCTRWDQEPRTDDEDWVFTLRDGDDTGRVEVSRETYDRHDVGQRYSK